MVVEPSQPGHVAGSRVSLRAVPSSPDAVFVEWIGAGVEDRVAAVTGLAADADKRVVAVFRTVREIRSLEELKRVGRVPEYSADGHYTLAADLDASGEVALPLLGATRETAFTGTLDGAGHAIRNLRLDGTNREPDVALVGFLGRGGAVRNLRLLDVAISGGDRVAGLVANNHGTVSNCLVTGTVNGRDTVGGVVGQNFGELQAVTSMVRVGGGNEVGGIVGVSSGGTIGGARALRPVEAVGTGQHVGGVVGRAAGTRLVAVQSEAAVRAFAHAGLIAGRLEGGEGADLRVTDGVVGAGPMTGGIAGSAQDVEFAGIGVRATVEGTDGTAGVIGSAARVDVLSALADVRVSGVAAVGGLVGSGVGTVALHSRVEGLVEGARAVGGAVGVLETGQVSGVDAAARVRGQGGVGGIAGSVFGGEIAESASAGVVSGRARVGGIAGENQAGGRISDVISSAAVEGASEVGGIAGYHGDAVDAPRIRNSLFVGTVAGVGLGIGGIAGSVGLEPSSHAAPALQVIESSYWLRTGLGATEPTPGGTGATAGELRRRATFVGWDLDAVWAVAEGVAFPRLRWQSPQRTVRVWVDGPGVVEVQPARESHAVGDVITLTASSAGTGIRFEGWVGLAGVQGAGPVVQVRVDSDLAVRAHFRRVHAISTLDELASIGREPRYGLDDRYWLAADIDAAATSGWTDGGGGGFPPIGSMEQPFTGAFDGQGRTIRGLSIRRPQAEVSGLFGAMGPGAVVAGLGLDAALVAGGRRVGGLVGANQGGVVRDVRFSGTVSGRDEVGGIAGLNQGLVEAVVARSAVAQSDAAMARAALGGIVGLQETGVIRRAMFDGALVSTGATSGVGGIVGRADRSVIRSSQATGRFGGGEAIGGVAGSLQSSAVEDVWADVRLEAAEGSRRAGGVVGEARRSRLTRLAGFGRVEGSGALGGIAGEMTQSAMSDGFTRATVVSAGEDARAGGIAGVATDSSLRRVYAAAPIGGVGRIGGLIGSREGGLELDSSHWNADMGGVGWAIGSPQSGVGALSTEAMRQRASFVGWDFAGLWNTHPTRNDGFPYLRGLPSGGTGSMPGLGMLPMPALLGWLESGADAWGAVDLSGVGGEDLLAAYLLDRRPESGFGTRVDLTARGIEVGDGEIGVELDLRVGSVPFAGELNGTVAVEGAPGLEGPWMRLSRSPDTTVFLDGRHEVRVPAGDARFFRARLIPAWEE